MLMKPLLTRSCIQSFSLFIVIVGINYNISLKDLESIQYNNYNISLRDLESIPYNNYNIRLRDFDVLVNHHNADWSQGKIYVWIMYSRLIYLHNSSTNIRTRIKLCCMICMLPPNHCDSKWSTFSFTIHSMREVSFPRDSTHLGSPIFMLVAYFITEI